MTPRRVLTACTLIVILAVSLLYDAPAPLPAAEPTPTPGTNCDYYYERRGLGWEPWEIVEVCE